MAGSFLRLDLDPLGITAQILEVRHKKTVKKDNCRIVFDDLPDFKEGISPFDSGMDMVAQTLDLATCSTAVIFVPPFSVSFRNINLPFSAEKKIVQILPFELETVLPNTTIKYISDFHKLNLKDNPNLILTASIPESDIEAYFSALTRFDIKPVTITHKGYATAASFLKNRSDVTNFIFIYTTDHAHTLVLVKNKKPCTVREFNAAQYDPEKFVTCVSQTIIGFKQKTGIESAFDIFISSESDSQDAGQIHTALETLLEYQSRLKSPEHEVRKVLTQEKINGTALLSSIVPDKTMKYLFNFCKGKYGTSSFFETYSNHLVVAFILAFLAFSISIININMDISALENKIARIDNKAVSIFKSTFPETKKIADPYLQMKANVKKTLKNSTKTGENDLSKKTSSVPVVEIMNEVSRRIQVSTNMEITRFLLNNDRLILSGSTDNFNNVDLIKNKIESSNLFKKVSISSAAADKKGNLVNFKFIIEM